ncbi:MAG: Protein SphX [Phycisphaerae bacterium]|nr:Protein SphX [Phycisphaerae bacterium]
MKAIHGLAMFSVLSVWAAALQAQDANIVRIDGSSTVYPVTEAVAEEFQNANSGKIKVTVGISGTGGGFKKFTRGEIDIADASRPISEKEMEEARKNGIEYIELPIAFDALTVMVNPQNTWVDHLTVEELKKIWEPAAQGKITSWNQVRSTFPDAPLTLFGAGADSGTFDYFTEAIVGKAKSSRGDFTASEDDNVLVQGISQDKNALGFFGYAYYVENQDKLKAVPIDAGKGPVAPSEQTVLDATYYPLSRPIFIYINVKALERTEVQQFVDFYLKNVSTLAKEVKYVPLPADTYQKCVERVGSRQTGTAFGGHSETGVHIDELFRRELKN